MTAYQYTNQFLASSVTQSHHCILTNDYNLKGSTLNRSACLATPDPTLVVQVIFNSSSAIPRHPAQVIAVSGNNLIVA
jgi:hypothetical protein